jgi:flagellar biosynthesis protein FlhG
VIAADQAEGLRRLIGQSRPRALVMVAGARTARERTAAVLAMAASLSANRRRLLLVDENAGPDSALAALGLGCRHDLLQVLTRERALEQIALPGPNGMTVVCAARAARTAAPPGSMHAQALSTALRALPVPPETVLINALSGTTGMAVWLECAGLPERETVLVVQPAMHSIVGAYALLKRARRECADQRFGVVLAGAQDEAEALAIHGNLDSAARRFVGATVCFLGFLEASGTPRAAAR